MSKLSVEGQRVRAYASKLSVEEQRVRAYALQVSCPACQALPDQACERRDQGLRRIACSPHKERIQRAVAHKVTLPVTLFSTKGD